MAAVLAVCARARSQHPRVPAVAWQQRVSRLVMSDEVQIEESEQKRSYYLKRGVLVFFFYGSTSVSLGRLVCCTYESMHPCMSACMSM